MPPQRRIYLLDAKRLSPETIAVAFAKTSRSPQSFDEIAAELSDEKSADFHEKWVVGYGHSSIAEHAVLHIAVENISRLAVECVESNRLASYTEKSSRYQIWKSDLYHIPKELVSHPLEVDYITHTKKLFEHYQIAMEKAMQYLADKIAVHEGESDKAYQARLCSTAADACRYYLPASALTNVGVTINARALEHAIIKMLSDALKEVNEIGYEIRSTAQSIVPTLVKYADENAYLRYFEHEFTQKGVQAIKNLRGKPSDWFTCVDFDKEGEKHVLAALLFHYWGGTFNECLSIIENLRQSEKEALMDDLVGRLNSHDIPLRELEYASLTFDILMDQGAYFEFKRHRMMTQTPQKLSTLYGFAMPKLLLDAGIGDMFLEDMSGISNLYERLVNEFPSAASYIVPNAFNRRVLVKTNLRSALHFIQLRSAPNAHFAMRRVALRMQEEINQRFPLITGFIKKSENESIKMIEEKFLPKTC